MTSPLRPDEDRVDTDADSVVLINVFEVSADAGEAFIAGWERAADFVREQDGYLDTTLHRSLRPDAEFRFANVAHWGSPAAFQAATQHADFRAAARMPYTAHPSPLRGRTPVSCPEERRCFPGSSRR
jgi:heme-degrading monooxygenase HmoA